MTNSELNCPLCQQVNYCAINSAKPCWCMNTQIPAELINQVPKEQKNKSCICASCVEKFNRLANCVNEI